MIKYIMKRLILLVIALFVILTMTFFLMDLMPGIPEGLNKTTTKGTKGSSQENWLAFLRIPVFLRYIDFLKGIFVGNHDVLVTLKDGTRQHVEVGRFGITFASEYSTNATDLAAIFFKPLKYTLMISVPAFILSTIIGISLGFTAGYKRGKWQDTTINVFVMLFVAIPSFILAILFIIFGKGMGLPVAFDDSINTGYFIESLILPILVMTLTSIAALTYYTRNEVVEILKSDFVAIARAKGLSEMQILKRHVFRNASIPLVSIIIPSFVGLLAGSFIIEIFFAVPGASNVIINAVSAKEIYIIEFSILFFTTLSLLTSLLVDVLYVFIDPRIKIAQSQKMSLYKRLKLSNERKKKFKNANLVKGDA